MSGAGMYRDLWRSIYPSVCCITFLREGKRLGSGSGFKAGKWLITNNHVIHVPGATHVNIRFVADDGYTTVAEQEFEVTDFKLERGSDEDHWDYAIFVLPSEFQAIPSLQLSEKDDNQIGSSIALFGFQFEQENLSIHAGVIASKSNRGNVRKLQLDASVNRGNSGGPLVDPVTGTVIGIVTRKETGLTGQLENLKQVYESLLQMSQQFRLPPGMSDFACGFDASDALNLILPQFRTIAREIDRSANVGIGFAFELERVRQELSDLAQS